MERWSRLSALTTCMQLISDNGLVVTGDYVSVNGLFEREMLEDDRLPLRTIATDYHYLTCIKVAEGAPATSVPDSRESGKSARRV